MLMAVRFEGKEHEVPDWLHTHTPEYPLADIRRPVVMDNARILWITALRYGDRNSMGQAALQDGWIIARSIRQGSGIRDIRICKVVIDTA